MKRRSVRFCRHARFKFRVLRIHGFAVTDDQVRETVLKPARILEGYKGRKVAEKALSSTHALRVAYEESMREIEVITFYPVRRGQ